METDQLHQLGGQISCSAAATGFQKRNQIVNIRRPIDIVARVNV